MIKFIHKVETVDLDAESITIRLAQVGANALAIPAEIQVRWDVRGNVHVLWRWLPGQDATDIVFGAKAELGFSLRTIIQKAVEGRPWGPYLPTTQEDED